MLDRFGTIRGVIQSAVEEASWLYEDARKLGDAGSVACSEIADAVSHLKLAKTKLDAARFRIAEILKTKS